MDGRRRAALSCTGFIACVLRGRVLAWVGPGPADAAAWGQEEEPPPVEGALLARLPALAECFEQGCVQDVLAALRARPGEPWAAEAVQALEKCGPALPAEQCCPKPWTLGC